MSSNGQSADATGHLVIHLAVILGIAIACIVVAFKFKLSAVCIAEGD